MGTKPTPAIPAGAHGNVTVKAGDYCGKIAVLSCGPTAHCNDPPNEQNCPSICDAAKVCPNLAPGQSIKYDCTNTEKWCGGP